MTAAASVGHRMSVIDVLHGFLSAQRVDTIGPRFIGSGLAIISADDDFTLVNTYVAVDATGSTDALAAQAADLLAEANLDPSRTEMIVPDALVALVPTLVAAVGNLVRRVVVLSEFLDSFLRPDSVCNELIESSPQAPNHHSGLLNEDDFVNQWADVPGLGRTPAIDHLFKGWAKGNSPRLCIVLAPAGHGKSKMTHILAKRIAKSYQVSPQSERPPVPILISFGQYRRTTSFAGVILEALDRFGNNRLTIEAFQYLISLGRILFILDGYDEMVESSPDIARDNISIFVQEAGPKSRILLTSRSTFYRTSSDVVGQVGDPLLAESDVQVVDLLPFDRPQAREYLRKRLDKGTDRSNALNRAQEVLDNDHDLEILGSPIFLAEFANSVVSERWSITDIRKRGSLQFLVERTFERERERQQHDFTDDQQRRFLEGLAFDLLTSKANGYSREDLEVFAAEAVDDELLLLRWSSLVSHHFLLPDDDRAQSPVITMRHQVWRDYFQGSALATKLKESNGQALDVVTSRDLPEGVLRSAAGFLDPATRARLVGLMSDSGDRLVRNLLRMHLLHREPESSAGLPLPPEFRTALGGRDLSGLTFSGIEFAGTDLDRTNLTGCYLQNCDLTGATFVGTVLNRTTLRDCVIPEQIADADVASVTIDNEPLFGPQVTDRYRPAPAASPSAEADPDLEFDAWAAGVVRERLGKFLKARLGESNAVFDENISWIAFMGGTDPRHRDFVVRRVYKALYAEDVVTEGRMSSSARPTVGLTDDPQVRAEVLAFVRANTRGPAIQRVMSRLVR